ncbi:hypothetical protein LAV76_15580 [Bacillus paramobilis]|uniref:hypothetical protein n=1 Tax=Bacillus paramobilis TaxID=2817477 RepID=UPI0030C903E5
MSYNKGWTETFCGTCGKPMKVGEYQLNVCAGCREKLDDIFRIKHERVPISNKEIDKSNERNKMLNDYMDNSSYLNKRIIPVFEELGYKHEYIDVNRYDELPDNHFTTDFVEKSNELSVFISRKRPLFIKRDTLDQLGIEKMKEFILNILPYIEYENTISQYDILLSQNDSQYFEWGQEITHVCSKNKLEDIVKQFLSTITDDKLKLFIDVQYKFNDKERYYYNPNYYTNERFADITYQNIMDEKLICFEIRGGKSLYSW